MNAGLDTTLDLTSDVLMLVLRKSAGPIEALGALHITLSIVEELARLQGMGEQVDAARAATTGDGFAARAHSAAEQIEALFGSYMPASRGAEA